MPSEFDFIKTADRWRRYSEEYFKEARALFFDLSRNLISLATFLFILGATILQFSNVDNLSVLDKRILISSWFSLFFSIVFGLYFTLKGNNFLNASGTTYENNANESINYVVKTQKAGDFKYPKHLWKELPRDPSLWPFRAQSVTFIAGFVLTLLFGATLVF